MAWTRFLLQLSFLISAHATPLAKSKHARSEAIAWGPCDVESPLPLKCGNLSVPLDYTNPESDETTDIQLLKVPAVHEPKKGSILFNFGGPGMEARHSLAGSAKNMQVLTGGHYDLIAQDPRGTANSLPISCYKTQEESLAAFTYSRIGELVGPEDKMALGRLWAGAATVSDACHKSADAKETGTLIGTAFTARDMMQIVDAVEDDGLLRYWGFSYGTVLGATVAAMFPDRMDRLLLDGVVNSHEYYHGYDIEVWADTDMVFSSFFEQCVVSPDACVLASENVTAAKLEKKVYSLLEDLRYHPIAYNGSVIDHSTVKGLIRPSLYTPGLWPTLAVALNSLLVGDIAKFVETQTVLAPPWAAEGIASEPLFAIPCSEKKTGKTSFSEVMPTVHALNDQSRLMGESGNGIAMTCSQWKLEAKERYDGDFQTKTKHPMLIIGNTYDPATPIRSAHNMSASFEGSVLLEHGGYGHCTLSHGSVCTGNAIRNYFMDGTLPKPGTVCEPAYPPFANKSWGDVLPEIGGAKDSGKRGFLPILD